MKRAQKKVLRICSQIIFGVYLIILIYFLFFAESMGRTGTSDTYRYNLVLFHEIARFWKHRESMGMMTAMNLLGNVAAFAPFGFLCPILRERYRSFWYTTLLTFECSLLVELVQILTKVGSFDVDDLLLNTMGGMMGYLLFAIVNAIRRSRNEKTS